MQGQNAKKKSQTRPKALAVAIIGATGLVGNAVLDILEERSFPIAKLFLLASSRSVGEVCEFKGKTYEVQDLADFDFSQSQLCFFCAGNEISALYVPKAVEAGNLVIDKSSYYRYDDEVPLIVPEVNAAKLNLRKKKNIIANPNCTSIPVAVALKPIYDAVGIKRINLATYQAVSGAGKGAIDELAEQTISLLNGQEPLSSVFGQQIAFNVLPQIDDFEDNGYTREEMKLVWELQKIFGDKNMGVNPTAVRVPVFYGHSVAVHLETKKKISAEEVKALLLEAPGIKFIEGKMPYPTPARDATGEDWVYVGRVREDISCKNGINLWVVTDNLRKGAALNAVQIAERLS